MIDVEKARLESEKLDRFSPRHGSANAFVTVVAANYIPQVLALYDSVVRHSPKTPLHVLILDADEPTLERVRDLGIVVHSPDFLQLGEREFLQLATIYDVVELATAVKPLFFLRMLHEYEQVTYLDPDTYLVSPLDELPDLVRRHGTVLTPHFLDPIDPGSSYISENHCLTVGIFNLGFGAFSRESRPLLEWWWGHLQRECLKYPLLGLFVDQKWMDLAGSFFSVHPLKHRGYNIGPWNLHERPIRRDANAAGFSCGPDPVRLLHFSGFDPHNPQDLSERLNIDMKSVQVSSAALDEVAREYASLVLRGRETVPTSSGYRFTHDAGGRRISRRVRQAYREGLLAGDVLPIPFVDDDLSEFRRWERRTWAKRQGIRSADIAIAAKYAFPDAYDTFRRKHAVAFRATRAKLLNASKVRR